MRDAAQTGEADPDKRTPPALLVTSAIQLPVAIAGSSINAAAVCAGSGAFRHR